MARQSRNKCQLPAAGAARQTDAGAAKQSAGFPQQSSPPGSDGLLCEPFGKGKYEKRRFKSREPGSWRSCGPAIHVSSCSFKIVCVQHLSGQTLDSFRVLLYRRFLKEEGRFVWLVPEVYLERENTIEFCECDLQDHHSNRGCGQFRAQAGQLLLTRFSRRRWRNRS